MTGILRYDAKNYNEALPVFYRCITANPNECLANRYLDLALFQVGAYDSAIIFFKQAVDIENNFIPAINSLRICYYFQKKYDSSIIMFKKSLSIDSLSGSVWNRIGDSFYKNEDDDLAIQSYENALANGENNISIYSLLGVLYRKECIYDMVMVYYKLYLNDDPQDAKRWFDMGMVYDLGKKTDSADICFQKSIDLYEKELNRTLVPIYVHYGTFLASSRMNHKKTEALRAMERSIQLNDKSGYTYYSLAQVHDNSGNDKETLKYYEKYLEVEVRDKKASSGLSM